MLEVQFTSRANKELSRIPAADRARILVKLAAFAMEPDSRPHDVKPLVGTAGLWRLRVGDWRLVFVWDEGQVAVQKVRTAGRRTDEFRYRSADQ